MTAAEVRTIRVALLERMQHVQTRYLESWERYCNGCTLHARIHAGWTYCRLKTAWERLEAAYEGLIQTGGVS